MSILKDNCVITELQELHAKMEFIAENSKFAAGRNAKVLTSAIQLQITICENAQKANELDLISNSIRLWLKTTEDTIVKKTVATFKLENMIYAA